MQDWIQHEVEKCQRRQVDAHERAERERKSIFAGLERELVELDRSQYRALLVRSRGNELTLDRLIRRHETATGETSEA